MASWELFTNNRPGRQQTIPHVTAMLYGECVKMCEDFALNFGDERTDCCITTTYSFTLHICPGNVGPEATWL
jgi:hypothetical protein